MTDPIRRDWIIPVLEDIRNFLQETDRDDFAQDIDGLIQRYGPLLREEAERLERSKTETEKVIDLSAHRSKA